MSDVRDDAGNPCPGATILHPGTESRKVGTSVPFVGRARDATCTAITGNKLVWTQRRWTDRNGRELQSHVHDYGQPYRDAHGEGSRKHVHGDGDVRDHALTDASTTGYHQRVRRTEKKEDP